MIYGLDDFIPFYKPTGLGSVLLYESICIELRTSNFGGAGGDIIGGAGGDINGGAGGDIAWQACF